MNQISNAPNNLIFGRMLEEFEDERQDALVDDAHVRGGALALMSHTLTSQRSSLSFVV